MFKKFGFWVAIFFLVLAIVSMVMYFVRKNMTIHADEVIESVSGSFKEDLKLFLGDVELTANKVKKDATEIDVDKITNDSLSAYFSKLIENEKHLMGIVLLGQDKNYVMINDNKSWVITHNKLSDSLIDWVRFDRNLQRTGGWTEAYNEFMDNKNFGSIKISDLIDGNYVWRSSQSEVPERRNMLFTVFRTNTENFDIVALIYRTGDLGNRFSRVLQFDSPLVSIITSENYLVTPMRTTDTARISSYNELSKEVGELVKTWAENDQNPSKSYTFNFQNQEYWSRFDTINSNMGISGFAVTISNYDLTEIAKSLEKAYLYASIMFLLFALFAYLTSYRKLQKSSDMVKNNISSLTGDELLKLIKKGETEFVEFKSSLRWDYREEKVNKALEDVILKSISAFSNAKGGTLFIGVNDNMEVIGMEPDFKTLKKQDADYFELHIRKLINNQFGIRFSNKHLLIQFPEFEGKIICVIYITSGDSPLYLKTRNKQGHEVEKFYVRSGNASQEIASLQEINEYVNDRFSKNS